MLRAFPVEGPTIRIYFRPAAVRSPRATRMCASLRPPLRLIFNAAGVQFTPLSILQTHAFDREHRRSSLRRIDRRTPLPDRGGRCRDRPLARLHRPDSRGPKRADALLRTNARRSRRTAAPVVDSRARTASGGMAKAALH